MSLRLALADLHDEETRVTDEATGGQKGVKLTQVGALDPVALMLVARVAGFGAEKYAAFNYLKGYDWAHSFNAMQRHAMLFWAGEDTDSESGLPHMAHAAWHALALISFAARGVGTDTRPVELEPVPSAAQRALQLMLVQTMGQLVPPAAKETCLQPECNGTCHDGPFGQCVCQGLEPHERPTVPQWVHDPAFKPETAEGRHEALLWEPRVEREPDGPCSGCEKCEPDDL